MPVSLLQKQVKEQYLIDISNAFAEIEFGIFDAVASFNFDEGGVGRCVAFSAGV